MNVKIVNKKSGKITTTITIFFPGRSEKELKYDAWKEAVDDGNVKADDWDQYDFIFEE